MHTVIRLLIAYAALFVLALAFGRGLHSNLRVVLGARGAYAYLVTRLFRWKF